MVKKENPKESWNFHQVLQSKKLIDLELSFRKKYNMRLLKRGEMGTAYIGKWD